MNKAETANALYGIAEILEINGGINPFKVMAYKKAAGALAESPLSLKDILARPHAVPGVGPDTLKLIRAIQSGGIEQALGKLAVSIPFSVRELIEVPGIGPKTAHTLYHKYGIDSLQTLEAALAADKLRGMPGFGIQRMARLKRDVAVLVERHHALPIAVAWPLGNDIQHVLADIPGVAEVAITGSARRLVVMSPRVELVVSLEDEAPFEAWCAEQHAVSGDQSVDLTLHLAADTVPVRIYPVPRERFAQKLMETTGDDTHQEVLTGLLGQRGYQWTADGIVDETGQTVAVSSEEDIYRLVELPCFPPELREGRGLLRAPKSLLKQADLRGDLHVHSNWSDGSFSIQEVVAYAERMGYEYVAITDHSQSLTIARGLTPERLREQMREIERVRQTAGITILHGTEVDILADGTLDLPDDVLWELDIVVASVHSAMHQSKPQMTERILKAVQHPAVDIIGHPTGRVLGRRSAYELDIERIITEAAQTGVAVELNANPHRLDLFDEWLRLAAEKGVPVAIDTDTHHPGEMEFIEYGVRMAKRGWLGKSEVLNTLPYDELLKRLHQSRTSD